MKSLGTVPKQSWMLAIAAGVLQVIIFPKLGWAFLSWICLVPLLYALLNSPRIQVLSAAESASPDSTSSLTVAQGFWLGYLSGIVCHAGSCYWIYRTMRLYGGLSVAMSAIVLFLFSLYLGLYQGLFGALLVRISRRQTFAGPRALLVAPFLWTAVELARSRITGFPWDPLGNALVDNIPLTRIATITGVFGLSFIIAAVNVLFAAALLVPSTRRLRFAVAAIIAALVLQAGVRSHPRAFKTDHIARLVQLNIPIVDSETWNSKFYEQTLTDIATTSVTAPLLNAQQPRLVIWPESPAPFYVNDPKFRESASRVATASDAFLIAGSLGLETPQNSQQKTEVFNSAVLVGPTGAFLARYNKNHLVPFGEYVPFQSLLFFAEKLTREVGTFSRGNDRDIFSLSGQSKPAPPMNMEHMGHMQHDQAQSPAPAPPQSHDAKKAGVFICYESVFPDEVRLFALNGADLFVNISNDGWYGDTSAPLQLLAMSRMRAIENHRWLLRATNTGITTSIDPYGRVVATAPRNIRTTLDAPYAFNAGTTFYTRHGDWFAWACAIISLAAIILRLSLRAAVLR